MAAFEETFDARQWAAEHGVERRGLRLVLKLTAADLASSLQIPSCATWEIPSLGLGQAGGNHEGHRGTLSSLLERSRRDLAKSRSLYGEQAARSIDGVLAAIDEALSGEEGFVMRLRDPSGLAAVHESFVQEKGSFVRSEAENEALGFAFEPSTVEKQVTTVKEVAELVRKARRVVALTGAGISVESGITPFRNPSSEDKDSIWGSFDAAKMTVQNFNSGLEAAEGFWSMERSLNDEIKDAVPNAAHMFFKRLEEHGRLGAVVTQNIDSLHLKAGIAESKNIEVHGHTRGLICSDKRTALNPIPSKSGTCSFSVEGIAAVQEKYRSLAAVPLCPLCGSALRPETVMFGQPLPQDSVERAMDAIETCDLLMVIGSTLIVAPVNEFPRVALRNGTPVVMINFDETQYDALVTGLVREKAGEFLAAVTEELGSLARPEEVLKEEEEPVVSAAELRAVREGAQKGRDAANMSFFCGAVSESQGDVDLLGKCLAAMHAECPSVGKMLFSDGAESLEVLALVPEGCPVDCGQWLRSVAAVVGGVVQENGLSVKAERQKDVYPIKLKDPGILAAYAFLKEQGLLVVEEEEDEWVYGDDDFPLC